MTTAFLAAYIATVALHAALIVGVGLGKFHLADRWVGVLLAGTVVNPSLLLLVLKFWFPNRFRREQVESARRIEPRRRTESFMSDRYLGSLEQLVLMAIMRLGASAYGRTIHDEIIRNTGQTPSRSSIYITLQRLEEKGFVSSRKADPSPNRAGLRRRYFRVEIAGANALNDTHRALDAMRIGLTPAGELLA